MNPMMPAQNSEAEAGKQSEVEYVRANRETSAYVLLALGLGLLILAIFFGYKTNTLPVDSKSAKPAAAEADEPEAPKLELTSYNRSDYIAGSAASALAFLIVSGAGCWLLANLADASEDRERTKIRVLMLLVGGSLGALCVVAGGFYFYRWSESLTAWLQRGEQKQMIWVVVPLLMVIVGAGLMFLSLQPVRIEERNNRLLRRVVYASNLAVTALLLFVVLVIANVAFAVKYTAKLDTTSSGFYTLGEPTKEFLSRLDQPVIAYALLPGGADRELDDVRRLLEQFKEGSGGKFTVEPVALQSKRMIELRTKFTQLGINDPGVLIAAGEDQTRSTYIRFDDFFEVPSNPKLPLTFIGESKLLKELSFLAESQNRPVVYFTQSAGELEITDATAEGSVPERSATQLRDFLRKNYLDVQPLNFDLTNPKVPDDAAVVIVAQPRTTLSEGAVKALTEYMNVPRGTRKGKLIVMADAAIGKDNRTCIRVGLEPLLSQFNINLENKFLLGISDDGEVTFFDVTAGFSVASINNRNTIATSLTRFGFSFENSRPITVAAPAAGQSPFRAVPLLYSKTAATWTEDEYPTDLRRSFEAMKSKPIARSRCVAAVVSEESTNRLAVFGSGTIASNGFARRYRGKPTEFDLIGTTVDWLRDRPPVPSGLATKTYQNYTFPPKPDTVRLFYFPLGLALLGVFGLGAAVWVIRRK